MARLRGFIGVGGILLVLAVACARHENFPPMLPITPPPQPDSLMVSTADNIVYDLDWTIDDPSLVVSFYRLYTLDPFTGAPSLIDSTTTTSVQINTQIPTPGIVFGVSSVTVQNVESVATTGSAP